MASKQKQQSKLSKWHGSYQGKRTINAFFSVGAAMVLLGALFKIMHWPHGGIILSIGMFTEVLIFLVSAFDKPFKEYDWDKVFTFDGKHQVLGGGSPTPAVQVQAVNGQTMQAVPEMLSGGEVASLSEGVKHLSSTAQQMASLSSSISLAAEYAKNIELATEQYAGRIGDVNKNLSSLNSMYEIQLRNMQTQSDAISKQSEMILSQTEHTRLVGESLSEIVAENQKIKQSTISVVEETNKYKEATSQLTSQVSDLNKVYGNMLNALN